ncbi:hypothetical protein [Caldiplasma sukawensis]
MVVLRVEKERLLEKDLKLDDLEKFSRVIGFSIENDEEIKIELNPDRPDLYSVDSIIEQMNIYSKGVSEYGHIKIKKFQYEKPERRPYFAFFKVENVKIDQNDFLEYCDRISENSGRSRKGFAIGVHDLDHVNFPIKYGYANQNEKFRTFDDLTGKISDLVREHEKGKMYASDNDLKKPLAVMDSTGIISVPPLFNSYRTRVNGETKSFLVDITAEDEHYLRIGISLTAFYFLRKKVDISLYTEFKKFNEMKIKFNEMDLNGIIGGTVKNTEFHLKRMGYILHEGYVTVPLGRVDVMGPIDIYEDVFKSAGLDFIPEIVPKKYLEGKPEIHNQIRRNLRSYLLSLNLQEVMTFVLQGNKENNRSGYEILNPKSEDYSSIRTDFIDNHLKLLSINKKNPYPQKIFEIGDVMREGKQVMSLAITIAGEGSSYSKIKGYLDSTLYGLSIKNYKIEKGRVEFLIEGRAGYINVNGKFAGYIGEVDPLKLQSSYIDMPVSYLFLMLDEILL